MADTAVADPPPPSSTADDFNGLPAPPMDPNFFNQDLPSLNLDSVDQDDIMLEDLDFDFDFSLDLLSAPIEQPASDPAHFDLNGFILRGSDANFTQFASVTNLTRALKSTSPEFTHVSGKHLCGDGAISNSSSSAEPEICQLSGHQVSGGQRLGNNQLS